MLTLQLSPLPDERKPRQRLRLPKPLPHARKTSVVNAGVTRGRRPGDVWV